LAASTRVAVMVRANILDYTRCR